MQFRLDPVRVFRLHLAAIAVLLAAHLGVVALAILCAGALLWATGAPERGAGVVDARLWRALGALFVLLSLDESLALHERTSRPLREVTVEEVLEMLGIALLIRALLGFHARASAARVAT